MSGSWKENKANGWRVVNISKDTYEYLGKNRQGSESANTIIRRLLRLPAIDPSLRTSKRRSREWKQ